MDLRIIGAFALGLSACATATSEIVSLQNAEGKLVQCGPYKNYGKASAAARTVQQELRYCIEDLQRQGYKRVRGPV